MKKLQTKVKMVVNVHGDLKVVDGVGKVERNVSLKDWYTGKLFGR